MLRLIVVTILCFVVTTAAADKIKRETYQKVIAERYSGFHILNKTDFADSDWLRNEFHDGDSGSLIIGHFDFDKYGDFAAIIVSSNVKRNPYGTGDDYYVGKQVVCYGSGHDFDCRKEINMDILLPYWDIYLIRVPPGDHECYVANEANEIEARYWTVKKRAEVDSIGSVVPEKASGHTIMFRDGTSYECTTSD